MGNPAARASIDKAAHDGPIQSGSPNVNIGGFPAARKDDPIGCSTHGSGTIVGGSGTVFVNGKPLARLGDQTKCNASSSPAAAPAAKTAPPQYWGGTLAKDAGKDGMIHKDNLDARVFGIYKNEEDKNGDGVIDSGTAGVALADITLGNMNSDSLAKGEMRTKVGVASVTSTNYDDTPGIAGADMGASASVVQYGATGAVGKKGVAYGDVSGDVSVATAEAKANGGFYYGDKGRLGVSFEGGAEAHVFKAEATTNIDIGGVLVTSAKLGGTAGSAGMMVSGGIYVDSNDYSLNVNAGGELAVVLGLKGDLSVKFAVKPIMDGFMGLAEYMFDKDASPGNGDGKINSGCVTVLVGG